jgi:hypothetical protein
MHYPRFVLPLILLLIAVSGYPLKADVKTEEKTRVQFSGVLGGIVNFFGGKAAREGVTSTVAVKGDRKATTNDTTGHIVDLSEEKIYDIDIRRKTYKVITFADLRRQIEDARRKAEEESRKIQTKEKEKAPDKAPERDPNAKEMDIDFAIKNTGQTKTVSGYDTHEVVLTITVHEKGKKIEDSGGLALNSDMWVAPTVTALKEIRDFDIRFAQKMAGPMMMSGASAEDMGRMLAAYPMMKDALAKMSAEGGKIDGTPLMTTLTFDAVKSADQVAEEAKQSQDDKPRDNASVGGLLGGLARRAAQRKSGAQQDENKSRATFMTSTTEVLKISSDVTTADTAVPAGFKENK